MIAVLDTHVLLWWFDRCRRLTRGQRRILGRNDADHPIGIADISLWPAYGSIASEAVALTATRDWDPADRSIVASARVLGLPLWW